MHKRDGNFYFRTDCNEVGFTFDQLNALTRVGQSTKKGNTSGQQGYIGEKGIGFKSVFKVADTVQVASGFYEFSLDRRKPLGMILPIQSCFPMSDRRMNHTQFLLQLKSSEDFERIKIDLRHLEPQLLLFVRRLRELTVKTPTSNISYQVSNGREGPSEARDIIHLTSRNNSNNQSVTTSYHVVRHTVMNLPAENRRPGISMSEVVLAFPTADTFTEIPRSQKTFAFLPVDDFGFKVSQAALMKSHRPRAHQVFFLHSFSSTLIFYSWLAERVLSITAHGT